MLDENRALVAYGCAKNDAQLIAQAPYLLECLEHIVRATPQFHTGDDIDGADLSEWMAIHYNEWKELVEAARGKLLKINKETGNYL